MSVASYTLSQNVIEAGRMKVMTMGFISIHFFHCVATMESVVADFM